MKIQTDRTRVLARSARSCDAIRFRTSCRRITKIPEKEEYIGSR